jgi:hypothetical protein
MEICRVVGRGQVPADVNSDGSLIDPGRYIADGVVGPYAYLNVGISLASFASNSFTLLLNGRTLLQTTFGGGSNKDYFGCLQVPVDMLRFGKRTGGATPEPGVNVFRAEFASDPTFACNVCANGVSVWTVTFRALHPIVLVHGWQSSPGRFGAEVTGGECADGANPALPGFDFVGTFRERRFPYDCQFRAPERWRMQLSSSKGGEERTALDQRMQRVALAWGAQAVHVIGHSKGGLPRARCSPTWCNSPNRPTNLSL